jgi:hypothetical protein
MTVTALAVVLIAGAGLAFLMMRETTPSDPPGQPGSTEAEPRPSLPRLTWPPPPGWEDYTVVELPPTGGTLDLRDDTDYRIVAPGVRTEAVHIRGGRNVVWIGGHIRIAGQPRFATAISRRAIVISDSADGSSPTGRTVHLEGLLIDGDDLSEGINTNAPSAVVQLQNIRVERVIIRGADDRDGTGGYDKPSHPDILQLWGGKRELRIDGLSGQSNYQGIFLNEDRGDSEPGPNRLRRIDIEMVETAGEDGYRYAGHRGFTWTPEASGRLFLDPGTVWLQHHRNSGWTGDGFRRTAFRDTSGQLVEEPVTGASEFGDNLHPSVNEPAPYTLQVGTDELGTFGYWRSDATVQVAQDEPAVRDLDGDLVGQIYSGRPPQGSYVPSRAVGLHYESPGYR